jgi:hypothetical protein
MYYDYSCKTYCQLPSIKWYYVLHSTKILLSLLCQGAKAFIPEEEKAKEILI